MPATSFNDPASPDRPVVTRFAPSPTGELHVGGARTALYSWAYARRNSGQFLLRFEDTDQKRSSKQAEVNILRDLEWLGLHADHDDTSKGESIPRQSERLDLYADALRKLDDVGLTYEDDGAIRFRMTEPVTFDDAVYGTITVEADDLEDFVIRKADGFPTFHLAVVVDDIDMGVTHVIRGQEHLSNTAKHAALIDALGAERPVWCHTPSILNPDGSKMSKRDKAKAARAAAGTLDASAIPLQRDGVDPDQLNAFLAKNTDDLAVATAIAEALGIDLPEINVADFRRSGYLPDVLLNYLALLGWNPGNDLERFDLNCLSLSFGFDRIGRSNAKFDREKLAAFNQDTILQMPPEAWAGTLRRHFERYQPDFLKTLGDGFPTFAAMYQERSKTLDDPAAIGRFFLEPPTEYQDKAVKKNLTKNDGEGLRDLAATRDALAEQTDWSAEALHQRLDALWQELDLKNMGGVAQPLRVALTGSAVSPEIGPTLALLGKAETLRRINACLASLNPEP